MTKGRIVSSLAGVQERAGGVGPWDRWPWCWRRRRWSSTSCVPTSRAAPSADAVYELLWNKANDLGALSDIPLAHPLGVRRWNSIGYPKIKWVLCHLGGVVRRLAERFDRGYEAFDECRMNISRAPSTYLKQFYYDTVNFDVNKIELVVKFAGVAGRARRHLRPQRYKPVRVLTPASEKV